VWRVELWWLGYTSASTLLSTALSWNGWLWCQREVAFKVLNQLFFEEKEILEK